MIDVKNMTAEEREKLRKQLVAEELEEKKRIKEEREEYKRLAEETAVKAFDMLAKLSEELKKAKEQIFEDFATIIKLKEELYGVRDSQLSHTFTTEDGKSVVLGYRNTDSFDDTVHVGIEKVKGYIKSLASGEKKEDIERVLNLLLKKDKNGNLKANRVLELQKIAEQINDNNLLEGVKIIQESYKPMKTSTFIECYIRDKKTGQRISIPLTMTGV